MIRALLLWLALALPAAAQDLPDWQHTSINDFAGVLTNDDTRILDQALIALNEETGVEGTVVTLSDRASYGGADGLEAFAIRLFNDWGVGDAERDDGFMVLFLRDDREARIELGAGYGTAYDGIARDIMDDVMLPAFRDEAYSAGLRDGTAAVIGRIAQAHSSGDFPGVPQQSWLDRNLDRLIPALFGLFGVVATFLFGYRKWNQNRCPQCGERGLITQVAPLKEELPEGGWRVEHDQLTRVCPACGWSDTSRRQRSHSMILAGDGAILSRTRIRRSGSGRSGGFGGGSSGGGGASGRW